MLCFACVSFECLGCLPWLRWVLVRAFVGLVAWGMSASVPCIQHGDSGALVLPAGCERLAKDLFCACAHVQKLAELGREGTALLPPGLLPDRLLTVEDVCALWAAGGHRLRLRLGDGSPGPAGRAFGCMGVQPVGPHGVLPAVVSQVQLLLGYGNSLELYRCARMWVDGLRGLWALRCKNLLEDEGWAALCEDRITESGTELVSWVVWPLEELLELFGPACLRCCSPASGEGLLRGPYLRVLLDFTDCPPVHPRWRELLDYEEALDDVLFPPPGQQYHPLKKQFLTLGRLARAMGVDCVLRAMELFLYHVYRETRLVHCLMPAAQVNFELGACRVVSPDSDAFLTWEDEDFTAWMRFVPKTRYPALSVETEESWLCGEELFGERRAWKRASLHRAVCFVVCGPPPDEDAPLRLRHLHTRNLRGAWLPLHEQPEEVQQAVAANPYALSVLRQGMLRLDDLGKWAAGCAVTGCVSVLTRLGTETAFLLLVPLLVAPLLVVVLVPLLCGAVSFGDLVFWYRWVTWVPMAVLGAGVRQQAAARKRRRGQSVGDAVAASQPVSSTAVPAGDTVDDRTREDACKILREAVYTAGKIGDSMACHLCDNKCCVHPRHLEWNTASANSSMHGESDRRSRQAVQQRRHGVRFAAMARERRAWAYRAPTVMQSGAGSNCGSRPQPSEVAGGGLDEARLVDRAVAGMAHRLREQTAACVRFLAVASLPPVVGAAADSDLGRVGACFGELQDLFDSVYSVSSTRSGARGARSEGSSPSSAWSADNS